MLSESAVLATLSARIKYYRAARDWSQEELAERASINRTYLAGIERARRNPSIRSIVKLANAFRVPLSVMFEPIPAGAEDLRSSGANRGRKRTRR